MERNLCVMQQRQAQIYDKHAKDLPPVCMGDQVIIQNVRSKRWGHSGVVVHAAP